MDRLAKYLNSIRDERPIKLISFYNYIDSLDLARPRQTGDIEARLVKGADYLVMFINPVLLNQLEKLALTANKSRVELSLQNNSHTTRVDGSFLLVRKGLSNPYVVIIDKDGSYDSPCEIYEDVLIIENRQNFIEAAKTVSFLELNTDFSLKQGTHVIYGEGNVIANSLHKNYLSQYQTIYLCLDFDLGGLTIADNLMHLLHKHHFIFLVPSDILSRLEQVVRRAPASDIDAIIKLGAKNPKLLPYAKIMKETQKVLEQESYLHG